MNRNQRHLYYVSIALASIFILICCATPRPLLRNPSASQPPGPAATKAGGLSAESARPAPVRPVPIRPAPPQPLAAPPQAAGRGFARAVALSGDTAVITAPGATLPGRASVGAAYVYRNTGSSFELQQVLVAPTDRAGESFGQTVALSGSQLAIGAFSSDIHITDIDASTWSQGEVYIFERPAEDWRYKEKLSERVPIQADHEYVTLHEWPLGRKMVIQHNTLVITGRDSEEFLFLFNYRDRGWHFQEQLQDSTQIVGALPDGLSIAMDENTIALGNLKQYTGFSEESHSPEKCEADAVCVFVRTTKSWNMQQCITKSHDRDQPREGHGESIALAGNTLAIGIPRRQRDGKPQPGAVEVYERTGAVWALQATLQAPYGHSGDEFGRTVALGGERLIVGNRDSDPVSSEAFVFVRRAGKWEIEGTYSLALPTGGGNPAGAQGPAPRYLGTTLSTDGSTLILGAAQVTPAVAAAQERALIVRFPVAP